MNWLGITLILCTYGLVKEFKPSEPYLYHYQHEYMNISADVLNSSVYPYWTYSYFILLIPAFLLTDLLLYKPVLIVESLSYIGVWLTLVFGRSVLSQQVGQCLYGLATATEVAYFSYIYVKVQRKHYARVTALTRAALQVGKFLAYMLSQLLLMLQIGVDYLTLNQISLGSMCLTLIFALLLPFVSWRHVWDRHQLQEHCGGGGEEGVQEESGEEELIGQGVTAKVKSPHSPQTLPAQGHSAVKRQPNNYREFVVERLQHISHQLREVFHDGQVIKWSLWWALTMCGDLQVGNYIQTLWGEAQKGVPNSSVYNGFVAGGIPLLSAVAIMLLMRKTINWNRWGELCLTAAALADFGALLVLAHTESIWVMYAGYALLRIIYQSMISIAQFNIICRIEPSSSGLAFGMNTFAALLLQTALTFVVNDSRGPLSLGIRSQFLVYSVYHLLIAVVFGSVIVVRAIAARRSS